MRGRRLLVALLLAGGCSGGATAPPARLWTLFDLAAALDRGASVAAGASAAFPGGLPAAELLQPAPDGAGLALVAQLAFVEGAPSAHVTTELWANYPAVWVQPMYRLVTAWDAGAPEAALLPGSHPVFAVGREAGFYSPFWQVYYAVVPEGTAPDRYRSSRQILDDRLPLHEGQGWLGPLVPAGTTIGPLAAPLPPPVDLPVGTASSGWGWVDGSDQHFPFLGFGAGRFTWDADRQVDEQPLFVFFARGGDGSWVRTGAPDVGGTGPLFARRPALAPGNRPAFGSFWRLYAVNLPADAGLFLPSTPPFADLHAQVAGSIQGLAIPTLSWQFADPQQAEPYLLKVALDASTCFVDQAHLATCHWLDSQAALEDNLPDALTPTAITVTSPLVSFGGQAVPPP